MNDNRVNDIAIEARYREKFAELEALTKEAREAQSRCTLISARIAGCVTEIVALGEIGGMLPPARSRVPEDRIWSEVDSGAGITGVTAR